MDKNTAIAELANYLKFEIANFEKAKSEKSQDMYKYLYSAFFEKGEYPQLEEQINAHLKKMQEIQTAAQNSEIQYASFKSELEEIQTQVKQAQVVAGMDRRTQGVYQSLKLSLEGLPEKRKNIAAARDKYIATSQQKLNTQKMAVTELRDKKKQIEVDFKALLAELNLFNYGKDSINFVSRNFSLAVTRDMKGQKANASVLCRLDFERNKKTGEWAFKAKDQAVNETLFHLFSIAEKIMPAGEKAFILELQTQMAFNALDLNQMNAKQSSNESSNSTRKLNDKTVGSQTDDYNYHQDANSTTRSANDKTVNSGAGLGLNANVGVNANGSIQLSASVAAKLDADIELHLSGLDALLKLMESFRQAANTPVETETQKPAKAEESTWYKWYTKIKGFLDNAHDIWQSTPIQCIKKIAQLIPVLTAPLKFIQKAFDIYGVISNALDKIEELYKLIMGNESNIDTPKKEEEKISNEIKAQLKAALDVQLSGNAKLAAENASAGLTGGIGLGYSSTETTTETGFNQTKFDKNIDINRTILTDNERNMSDVTNTSKKANAEQSSFESAESITPTTNFSIVLLCETLQDGKLKVSIDESKSQGTDFLKNGLQHQSDINFKFSFDAKSLVG
jgi:hypothetical protein